MSKWVKTLTAMALASSLFLVGCNNNDEEKKKDEETTTQQDEKTDQETSKDSNSSDPKEKNKIMLCIVELPQVMRKLF
ncbi:hypothetical protein K4569_16240 [Bacillus bingmayongensis]|nr:hypothetical protein [Bacillus bingmayongensis]MBY0597887.1 hypothetical protein [Bacillus bingmayongensis]